MSWLVKVNHLCWLGDENNGKAGLVDTEAEATVYELRRQAKARASVFSIFHQWPNVNPIDVAVIKSSKKVKSNGNR